MIEKLKAEIITSNGTTCTCYPNSRQQMEKINEIIDKMNEKEECEQATCEFLKEKHDVDAEREGKYE
jgi:hypothetical protein